jgi:hypothetical protein
MPNHDENDKGNHNKDIHFTRGVTPLLLLARSANLNHLLYLILNKNLNAAIKDSTEKGLLCYAVYSLN